VLCLCNCDCDHSRKDGRPCKSARKRRWFVAPVWESRRRRRRRRLDCVSRRYQGILTLLPPSPLRSLSPTILFSLCGSYKLSFGPLHDIHCIVSDHNRLLKQPKRARLDAPSPPSTAYLTYLTLLHVPWCNLILAAFETTKLVHHHFLVTVFCSVEFLHLSPSASPFTCSNSSPSLRPISFQIRPFTTTTNPSRDVLHSIPPADRLRTHKQSWRNKIKES